MLKQYEMQELRWAYEMALVLSVQICILRSPVLSFHLGPAWARHSAGRVGDNTTQ